MATSEISAAEAAPATQLHGRLRDLRQIVEARLPDLLPSPDRQPTAVHEAMHYALTSPGKRLRPVLTLAVAEIFGARPKEHLDLACTVEMVHAASLILDDLPSMDDAALRRGRPTTHRKFGEATALLASFGLLNRAFSLLADRGQRLKLRRYSTEDMVHHLADAIGSSGLIGGQALDLASQPEDLDLERLEFIHSHKTGALFLAAGELGAMAADARRRDLEMISRYAKNLGLAFQITDDLLDVLATPEETGKDGHQDEARVTFVKLLGVGGAQALAAELLDFAVESLSPMGRKGDPLRSIARFVAGRNH